MKLRKLTAVFLSMITIFSVSVAAKAAEEANVYPSRLTADGKYYDAETDSYLSGFISVQNGVATPMTAEQYLNAQVENYTEPVNISAADDGVMPALSPFQKYVITSSGPLSIDTSHTYVVSALGGKGITISASISKSINTTFQAGLTASYKPVVLDGITVGASAGLSHSTATAVSSSYSNTVRLNYGRMCFQPTRKIFTGDIEQWSFITLNRPPVYDKTLQYNVKAYVPATYTVDDKEFADGVYFLVERNTVFDESDLN